MCVCVYVYLCVSVCFPQLNTTVEFELFVLIAQIVHFVALINTFHTASINSTVHSQCKREWEGARSHVPLPQRSLLLFPLRVGKARAFFVCVRVHENSLVFLLCAAAAVAVAALVYVFTIKRTEVEHADEREGALPAYMCASRTERKQNIKFKGKQRLWKRNEGMAKQRASRRCCCCSLLRWLTCAASVSVAVSFVSSQQHFSAAFLVLVVVAAASELCAA